jgi:hypothetical protein
MKRTSKFIVAALLLAGGTLFAQDNAQGTEPDGKINRRPGSSVDITVKQAEEITISGKLSLDQGFIALQSDGKNYYLRGINRFAGFIDGLKEGAEVTLKGFAVNTRKEDAVLFMANKLTINGRDYDLVPQFLSDGRRNRAESDAEKNRQVPSGPSYRRYRQHNNRGPQGIPSPGPGMRQRYGRGFNHGMIPRQSPTLRMYRFIPEKRKQENAPLPEGKK